MSSFASPAPKMVNVDQTVATDRSTTPPHDVEQAGPRQTHPIPARPAQSGNPRAAHGQSTQKQIISHNQGSNDHTGFRAPQNTPADKLPIAAIRPAGQGNRRPIIANSIRGRGISHAVTPGNTPSSLERITKRIASNLLGEGGQGNSMGKIAPSYELRFNAGLHDLDKRFAQASGNKYDPPSSPPPSAGSGGHASGKGGEESPGQGSPAMWPQSFASVSEAVAPAAHKAGQ